LSWYFIPLLFGFILLLRELFSGLKSRRDFVKAFLAGEQKKFFVYLIILMVISGFLICYYGSWLVQDNINGQITIGTSYLRYWLPSFILGLPLVVYLFDFLIRLFKDRMRRIIFATIISVMFVLLSINLVWLWGDECLLAVRYNTFQYQIKNQIAQRKLPSGAIIINSGVSDKIFWPELRVINWDGKDASFLSGVKKLINQRSFYYYSHLSLPKKNLNLLNEQLGEYNLVLGEENSLNGEDRIYTIKNYQLKITN